MKKKIALFDLYINFAIYKLLALFLVMGIIQGILCFTKGRKYFDLGFARVIEGSGQLPVIITAFLICLLVIDIPIAKNSHTEYHFKMLHESFPMVFIINFLSKVFFLALFYLTETALLFGFGKIYSMTGYYKGGPYGIMVDYFRNAILKFFFPYKNMALLLKIILIILALSLICTIVSMLFQYRFASQKEFSKGEKQK